MSLAGIFSSSLFNCVNPIPQSTQAKPQSTLFQQQFQQLGKALQSGNLSSAQSVVQALQQGGTQPDCIGSSQNGSSATQGLNQISLDINSGNLSAAQQDYATIQQNSQNSSKPMHDHHWPHETGTQESAVNQSLNQLGQALQSGNLSVAQQAYNTVQQEFLQFPSGGTLSPASSSNSFGITI